MKSSQPSLCSDQCRPGRHLHSCQYCSREFEAKRSDTRFCPAPPGSASRLSECAKRAHEELNAKQCAHVYPEGDQCPNRAQVGLKDGYCSAHHRRSQNGLDMSVRLRKRIPGRVCSVCGEAHYAKGLCRFHWGQQYEGRATTPRRTRKAGTEQCSVEENGERCPYKVRANGLCDMHNQRLRHTGEVGPVGRLHAERGSGHLNDRGYVEIQLHGKKRHQHLRVADEMLGEEVDTSRFEVHHKNGIRSDNRPENLEIVPIGHGAGQHFEDLVPFIIEHNLDLIYRRDSNFQNFPTWAKKS